MSQFHYAQKVFGRIYTRSSFNMLAVAPRLASVTGDDESVEHQKKYKKNTKKKNTKKYKKRKKTS